MHMADALISPAVGGVMWASSLAIGAYSIKKLNNSDEGLDNKKIPLMGVAGAFVFAAQMINFAIPATGSSGHLGGGLLLAALLGPCAGFLVMGVTLLLQALLFADGGLLALGCNIFNMGFLSCFIAYPIITRPILAKSKSVKSIFTASILGAVAALLSGAFAVVVQTTASGVTELPFSAFAALMLPIHLAIGVVEGIATAAVLVFVNRTEPSVLDAQTPAGSKFRTVLAGLMVAAVVLAAFVSWFASSHPDGLEWSIEGVAGVAEISAEDGIYTPLAELQETTSLFPDYNLKDAPETDGVINAGGSLAGTLGVLAMLGLSAGLGMAIRRSTKKSGGGTV